MWNRTREEMQNAAAIAANTYADTMNEPDGMLRPVRMNAFRAGVDWLLNRLPYGDPALASKSARREGWLIAYENSQTQENEYFVRIYATFDQAMIDAREACKGWEDTDSGMWEKTHSFGGSDRYGIISRAHHHYCVSQVILP